MTAGPHPADDRIDAVLALHEQLHLTDGNHVKGIRRVTLAMNDITLRHVPHGDVFDDGIKLL